MPPPCTPVFDVPLQTTCSTGGDQICSFNDDLHRTAAITVDAIASAIRVTGGRLSDQRIVITAPAPPARASPTLSREYRRREQGVNFDRLAGG